jgi:hypothetical protein
MKMAEETQELIDLDAATPEVGTTEGVIDLNVNPDKTTLPQKTVDTRSLKAHLGLKELSPGEDALRAGIARGDEDYLRQNAATNVALRDRQIRLNIIEEIARKQGGAVSTEDLALVKGLTNEQLTNPKTVFETQYAKSYTEKLALSKEDGSSPMKKGLAEDPDDTALKLDIAQSILARQEIAKTKLEESEARWKELGVLDKTLSIGGTMIPGKSWLSTWNAIKDRPASEFGLPGGILEREIQNLWLLPPDQFEERIDAIAKGISNPLDQQNFLKAVVGFSSQEQLLQDVLGVADVLDIAGIAGVAAKGAAAAVKGAARATNQAKVGKAIRDSLKVSEETTQAERITEVLGDNKEAIRIKAIQKVMSESADEVGADIAQRYRGLIETVPSIARPSAIVDSNLGRLTGSAASRLAEKLEFQADRLLAALTEPMQVERLTPEALARASDLAEAELRKEFTRLNDSVLDVVRNPRDVMTNTDSVSIRLGTTEAKPFDTAEVAQVTARDIYNLDEGYEIGQEGNNFFIEVRKAIKETDDATRNLQVTTKNKTPWYNDFAQTFLARWRSPAETMGSQMKDARNAATFGYEQAMRMLNEVSETIGQVPKKARPEFEKVLTANRDYVSPDGLRGRWHGTVTELEQSYLELNGRLPSEKEIEAYFSYVQLNDIDWLFRNTTMLRDKQRLGLKQFQFDLGQGYSEYEAVQSIKTPWVDGRKVNGIPWGSEHLSMVFIDPATKQKQVIGRSPPGEVRAKIDALIKDEGYDVIQIANPLARELEREIGSGEPIQYVITKGSPSRELPAKQLGYAPGGHVEHKNQYWVKQPKVFTREGGVQYYEGDTVAFNFSTAAQAQKYAQRMDDARRILLMNDDVALSRYLADNLPYSLESFKKLFDKKTGYYDRDQPFFQVESGQRVGDLKVWKDGNPKTKDITNENYNLADEIDRKFAGERDLSTNTITEATEESPGFTFTPSPLLDPSTTLARSLGQAARSRYFGDLKVQAAEQWIEEFSAALSTPLEELRKAPLMHFHSPKWNEKADRAFVNTAKAVQENTMTFIGQRTPFGKDLDYLGAKLMDSVYNIGGERRANWISSREWATTRDPVGLVRSFAFHMSQGIFNPAQVFVQAQGLAAGMAINPRYAVQSMTGYAIQRILLRNSTKEVADYTANMAAKLGWKADEFKEATELMNRSGWNRVGRETATRDNMVDPPLFSSTWGKFLDFGLVFFRESEQMVRAAGFNSAYLEWKANNPGKLIGNRELGEILTRADTLTTNMTRASKTQIEQGIFSLPTQFSSYQARLMDQFWGKQLTLPEKMRLAGMNALLYGVPATVAAGTGIPLYESVKTKLLENGYTGEAALKFFMEGVPSTLYSFATGKDYNIAQRYGPNGFTFVKDFLNGDKTAIETVMGPGGSAVVRAAQGVSGIVKGLTEVAREGGSYEPLKGDMIDALRAISSVNNTVGAIAAYNYKKYVTKNGVNLGKMDEVDAVLLGLTGLKPMDVTDTFLQIKSLESFKETKNEAQKEFTKYYRRGMDEWANNNKEGGEAYMRRARAFGIAADIQPHEWTQWVTSALNGYQSVAERINERWWKQGPASEMNNRLEQSVKKAN